MTTTPLRCEAKLFGEYDPERGTLRVKCDSRWCGYRRGVVIIHEFDLATGEVVTHKYKDTPRLPAGARTEGKPNG